jgi:indolepyruvate ferredoxin oxidoreductase
MPTASTGACMASPARRSAFVAAGKNWLDLVWALDALGIDGAEAERLGVTTYKVGQTWPLDMKGFKDWAEGLELIVVVEEKRKLIEVQVKEAIFDDRRGRRVYGYKDGQGESCSSSIIRSTPRKSR